MEQTKDTSLDQQEKHNFVIPNLVQDFIPLYANHLETTQAPWKKGHARVETVPEESSQSNPT